MDKFIKLFQDSIIFAFIPLAIFLLSSCIYLKLKLSKLKITNETLYEKYIEKKKSFFCLLPFTILSLVYLVSKF